MLLRSVRKAVACPSAHLRCVAQFSAEAANVQEIPSNVFVQDTRVLTPDSAHHGFAKAARVERVRGGLTNPMECYVESLKNPTGRSNTIELDPRVFGVPIRRDIMHRVVLWQQAKKRQPNKTKTRSEVSGTTKKHHQQKGSGRARAGSHRAPQWKGGYKPHGQVLRSYDYPLQKKVRVMGLCSALSSKLADGLLRVVEDLDLESHKTGELHTALSTLQLTDNVLFLNDVAVDDKFYLAARNLQKIDHLPVAGANVYSILWHDQLVITPAAAEALTKRLIDSA